MTDHVQNFAKEIEQQMRKWVKHQEVVFDADEMINICILALRWKTQLDSLQEEKEDIEGLDPDDINLYLDSKRRGEKMREEEKE